jgi:hypothetical protein
MSFLDAEVGLILYRFVQFHLPVGSPVRRRCRLQEVLMQILLFFHQSRRVRVRPWAFAIVRSLFLIRFTTPSPASLAISAVCLVRRCGSTAPDANLFLTSCCFPGTIRAILKRCGAAGSFGGVIFPFHSDRAKNPSAGISTAAQRTATGEPAASLLATNIVQPAFRPLSKFERCDDAVWRPAGTVRSMSIGFS